MLSDVEVKSHQVQEDWPANQVLDDVFGVQLLVRVWPERDKEVRACYSQGAAEER